VIGLRQLEVEAGGFRVGPLDLEVADGEYAVLLGPSGAGKSLVLEALAGVRVAAAGRLVVDGDDVSRLAPERRRVGLVFQDGLLFPHLDVAGNVAYGLLGADGAGGHGRAGGRRGRAAAVRELAASVGAEHLLKRRPDTLSGGERQRVALARALAARPRALLLDEPLSAVDAEAREDLQDMLRALGRDRGLTVLHVTHDRAEAFALADVCAVLVGGRLRQVGRPQDVLRRPADDAVAHFLGARNVLRAARDPGDAHLARAGDGLVLRVADPLPDATVDVVVRPEDVECWPAHGAPPAAVNVVPATVVRLVLQGGHVLVGTEAPASLDALLTARRVEELGLRLGARVDLTLDPERLHVIPLG
jgi:ABC-type Fe3+/spermidine/putrescine transport system ATPase subunit